MNTELPTDYKRIEDHFSRPERLWLWFCEKVALSWPFWRIYDHAAELKGWRLTILANAYAWEEIQNEREWWPR